VPLLRIPGARRRALRGLRARARRGVRHVLATAPRRDAPLRRLRILVELPPSDVGAKPAAFQVVLGWTPAPDGGVDRFTIYRNASQLASLPSSATAYTDTSAIPGETYSYAIEARAGEAVTDRVLVTTKTAPPTPPLRPCRGQLRRRHAPGQRDGLRRVSGAQLRVALPAAMRGRALRQRRERSPPEACRCQPLAARSQVPGSYNGRFTIECAGTPVSSSVTIELRVDAARVIDREWRASRLVGTLDRSEAEQLGCRYSEAEFSVRARLVR
jgi:hypothetical protein